MFATALQLVLKFEGGYANHPNDPGGPTNFGVTHSVYHRYRAAKKKPLQSVRYIEPQEVHEIYERSYWDAAQCNLFDDSHPHTAIVHFDCAVNCGTRQAIKLLQEILGVTVDGLFGKVTLAALKASEDDTLAKAYLARRQTFYDRLISKRPKLSVFRKSWYHRLNKIAKHCQIAWSTNG